MNFIWNLFVEQPIKVAIVTMVIACVKKRPKWNQVSTREKNNLQTFLRIMLMWTRSFRQSIMIQKTHL